jgi:hypothetical protein
MRLGPRWRPTCGVGTYLICEHCSKFWSYSIDDDFFQLLLQVVVIQLDTFTLLSLYSAFLFLSRWLGSLTLGICSVCFKKNLYFGSLGCI